MNNTSHLTPDQQTDLLKTLKARFEKNTNRHLKINWTDVEARLNASTAKLWSLNEMENTGGEPDVVGLDVKTVSIFFMTARPKAPRAGAAFVTIARRWMPVRNLNPKILPSTWLPIWVLNY